MKVTAVLRNPRYFDADFRSTLHNNGKVERMKRSHLRHTNRIKGYIAGRQFKLRSEIVPVCHEHFHAYTAWRCRCCQRLWCFKSDDEKRYKKHFWAEVERAMRPSHGWSERRAIDNVFNRFHPRLLLRAHCTNELGEPLICYRCQEELYGAYSGGLWTLVRANGPDEAALYIAARAYLKWYKLLKGQLK